MALQPKQLRAIGHFCGDTYRPELSTYPNYRFTNKETGEIVTHSISTLVGWMDADKARKKREAAQEAREGKNNE